jgi:hypothetical protein
MFTVTATNAVGASPASAASAAVTPTAPASIGNPLVQRAYASDGDPRSFVVLPHAALPSGTLQSFQTWNQPTGAGSTFHAYVLRPTLGVVNGYTVIYDSGALTVPVPTNPAGEVATFPVSPSVAVAAGDVIGFYGQGVPFDIGTASDTLSYPAPVAPVLGDTVNLGVDAGFPIYPQARTYSFAATVTPSG